MQAATTAFGNIVASNVNGPNDWRVTIDVPTFPDVTLAVQSIEIEQDTTTDMPSGTVLISGYPSAQATIVLGGLVDQTNAAHTAAWFFNPASADSPLYRSDALGAAVVIELGLWTGGNSPELITKFTGTVDEVDPDMLAGTVTFTCYDALATKLTTAPILPSFTGGSDSGFPGLTSEFALDAIGRPNGAYLTWPSQRQDCVLAAGMRGSAWPEVGTYTGLVGIAAQTVPAFGPGPYGTSLVGVGRDIGYTLTGAGVAPADSILITCLVTLGTSADSLAIIVTDIAPDTSQNFQVFFAVTSTGPSVTVNGPSGAFGSLSPIGMPVSAASPHEVTLQLSWVGTALSGAFTLDGVTDFATGTSSGARSGSASGTFATVGPTAGAAVAGVQITTETSAATVPVFVPTAVMDPSLNSPVTLPDVVGQDAKTVIQSIAEAEGGYAGFDELGIFRFYNRVTLRTRTSSRTISSKSSLKTLGINVAKSTIANHITCPVNALVIGDPTGIWALGSVIGIHSFSDWSTVATLQDIAINIATTDSGFMPATGRDLGGTYWRASTLPDGTGAAVLSGIEVTVTQLSPTSIAINVHNSNSFPVYLANPAGPYLFQQGAPSLIIGGQPVTAATPILDSTTATAGSDVVADVQWPPVNEGGAAKNVRGEIPLNLQSNDWIQDLDTATEMITDLLVDLYKPRPLLTNVAILADPRLQLTDKITIDDQVSGIASDAVLFSITTSVSATDWTQSIDMRMSSMPGGWILGLAGHSELGVDTYL